MERKSRQNRKQSQAAKAKLDSKGRPIATRAPKRDADEVREDLVKAFVRLGAFAFLCLTFQACEPEAKEQPAQVDTRLETAVADAQLAGERASANAALAISAAQTATVAAERCEGAGGR